MGSILHHVCQQYDIDRFIKKLDIDKSETALFDRYHDAYVYFFTDPGNIKKERIPQDQQELALQVLLPALRKWLFEPNPKEAAQILHFINSQQPKMMWNFTSRKPLSHYYQNFWEIFYNYVTKNPLDALGEPVTFEVEKQYLIEYGEDELQGFVDEYYIFDLDEAQAQYLSSLTNKVITPGEKVFLKEMKSSSTVYTPEDCSVDNQMGLYAWYEHIDRQVPLEDIFVVMHQLPTNVCTLTQRSEENLDFLLRHVDARLERMNAIQNGALPLCKCGTNSYDHSLLLCDMKDICPIWKMADSQPKPIVLGEETKKKGKK